MTDFQFNSSLIRYFTLSLKVYLASEMTNICKNPEYKHIIMKLNTNLSLEEIAIC